ncbi:uncharacterized protein LOC111306464 [Durio zibethinus]|uniref:Uncharacterized protein LOC111306464 n=1 Tax=Durio zibethinus TaxID=66656 RepID=A0A6P6A504_DURZI|nr:uncharacterized protein LOC111306464 [Durio zibethinus]
MWSWVRFPQTAIINSRCFAIFLFFFLISLDSDIPLLFCHFLLLQNPKPQKRNVAEKCLLLPSLFNSKSSFSPLTLLRLFSVLLLPLSPLSWQLKHPKRKNQQCLGSVSSSNEVGGGYSDEEFDTTYKTQNQQVQDTQNFDSAQYEALLKGGDQVTSVLQDIITLVQVIGLLCGTPQKERRHELLCRVAAGGGAFKSENGTKVHIPGANLNDIANQADHLLETMETRPSVPDRKLLSRLFFIREEARNMMGGGVLDERNDCGFSSLPESEVNFLTKLVALKPGKTVQEMIKNVKLGKDEGADYSDTDEKINAGRMRLCGIAGRVSFRFISIQFSLLIKKYGWISARNVCKIMEIIAYLLSSCHDNQFSVTGRKPLPVCPGMFLETVTKVLGGICSGNVSGITAQHLEWVNYLLPCLLGNS